MESSEASPPMLVISMPYIDSNSHVAVTCHNSLGIVPIIAVPLSAYRISRNFSEREYLANFSLEAN